jgi:hypothetical protein
MIIHGFAFWKFAKPAHEHHLQVLPTLASLVLSHLQGLKKQRHLLCCKTNFQTIISFLK